MQYTSTIRVPQGKPLVPARFQLAWGTAGEDPVVRENLRLRSELMIEIDQVVRERRMTQAEVAAALGVSQPRVSALLNGRVGDFRLDALVGFAFKLGLGVELQISGGPATGQSAEPYDSRKEETMSSANASLSTDTYAYVCYSRADAAMVHDDIDWLQQKGVRLWHDGTATAEELTPQGIANAIECADKVLWYASEDALASESCQREMAYARLKGAAVVTVVVGGVTSPATNGSDGPVLRAADDDYRDRLLGSLT